MPRQECLESRHVEHLRFYHLDDSELVFGTAKLERDRRQVFGCEHARANAIDDVVNGVVDGFSEEGALGGQKLHRPPADHEMFSLDLGTAKFQELVHGCQRRQMSSGRASERDEHVHILGGGRLNIPRGADSATDGIPFDNSRHFKFAELDEYLM